MKAPQLHETTAWPVRALRTLLRLAPGWGTDDTVHAAAPVTLLATPTDAIYYRADVVFEVPIARCVDSALFSYRPDGLNPFIATLRDYGTGRHTAYEGSILQRYYTAFQPRTYRGLFLGKEDADDPLVRYEWSRAALDGDIPRVPWVPTSGQRHPGRQARNWAFGPMSDAAGRSVFLSFATTYESIRRDGYRPTGEPDGEIRGYFLRGSDDYRFVIRDGLHRAAALAALGHSRIRAKFRPHRPRTIDLSDLPNWPQVKNGCIEPELARLIFVRFFEAGDVHRARNFGLV